MKLKEIDISELKEPYDFSNYNKHPENQIRELEKSLEKFLQYKNIVIWKDNQVIAGNGLVEAAKRKDYKTLFVNDVSHLNKEEAIELLIADNSLPFLSEADENELNYLISELNNINIIGFNNKNEENNNAIKEKDLIPYKKLHLLISLPVDKIEDMSDIITYAETKQDIEITYGSN